MTPRGHTSEPHIIDKFILYIFGKSKMRLISTLNIDN